MTRRPPRRSPPANTRRCRGSSSTPTRSAATTLRLAVAIGVLGHYGRFGSRTRVGEHPLQPCPLPTSVSEVPRVHSSTLLAVIKPEQAFSEDGGGRKSPRPGSGGSGYQADTVPPDGG